MSTQCPVSLGLTGALASGKTTALKDFKRFGWKVWSADDVVAEIYKKKGLTKEKIIKRFGASEAGIRKLEKWIHPQVGMHLVKTMKKCRKPIVAEVPLLFESGFQKYFDWTVSIFAPDSDRSRRAKKRGMDSTLFARLNRRQWKAKDKADAADFVLLNRTKKDLRKQVKRLSNLLLQSQKVKKQKPSR